jgi:hypothetical protein
MKYFKQQQQLDNFFDKEYFHSINFVDYEQRREKYNRSAYELFKFLDIDTDTSILDYGCAVGFLLNGFRDLGVKNLSGYDVSNWAIENNINKQIECTDNIDIIKIPYDYAFVMDVFEHMFDNQIEFVLDNLNIFNLIVRLPVKLINQDDFHLQVSRNDPSHVNCKTKGEWVDYIESFGYRFNNTLNLPSTYDSAGCFVGQFVKVK